MDDVLSVAVSNGFKHLADDLGHFELGEGFANHFVVEIAARTVLHDQEKSFLVFVHFIYFHYIWMIKSIYHFIFMKEPLHY